MVNDMQFERLKKRVEELERISKAHEGAIKSLAEKLDLEVQVKPGPTEAQLFAQKERQKSARALLSSDEFKAYIDEDPDKTE